MGRNEDLLKLVKLNKQFLKEIEEGKTWEELKDIREELSKITKNLDSHQQATIIDFDTKYETGDQQKSGSEKK